MPTGYTAAVADGTVTAFPEFAITCARAFGALIMMRDEPSGTTIPDEFQPSDYSAKQLDAAKARWAALQSVTPEASAAASLAAYNTECESRAEAVLKRTQTRERYEAMLEEAKAWQAPTADHEGMKAFMIQQLEESIRFDCGDFALPAPVQRTGAAWLADQIAAAERDIAYHTKAHAEEVERTNMRNAWVKALRASLSPVAA
jgi:hypothetical protein